MRAVVLFESLTGNTRIAAELIGGAAEAAGAEVTVCSVVDIDLRALADADVVFLGAWTDGFVLFGQRPGRAGRIWQVPAIDHKLVATFCTYAINPRTTLDKLNEIVEAKGAKVVASAAFKRSKLSEGVDEFVRKALAAVPASAR